MKKDIINLISAQALEEIDFADDYKNKRISSWQKNEEMYYGKKAQSEGERANVQLGKMQEFVHTLLSKIDTPLVFKYAKRKDADLVKSERANAMRRLDSNEGDWDMKDLLGKKQAVIYGRAVYFYHSDNAGEKGVYRSFLENCDVYDFLIDPSAGGLDIENALYLGRRNVVKLRSELQKGVKDKLYIKDTTNRLLEGGGNNTDYNISEIDKEVRRTSAEGEFEKEMAHNDKYRFNEWWTTFEGERYYLLIDDNGNVIRIEKWKDLEENDKYPVWTWASYPDLTEFWTPSYCDYVREIFMAQSISINQMIDNAEQINKPQRAVDSTAIVDESELKYRKDGWIRLNVRDDVNKAFRIVETPSINTPIDVYNLLELIGEKASGVTAPIKGTAEEDKVTIYKGNLQAVNDRFNFLNKSYSHGYKRFAMLYYNGLKQNLKKKVAIQLMGGDGVQVEEITKKDIIPTGGRDFEIIVESSNSEMEVSYLEKQAKEEFYRSLIGDPEVNQKKLKELRAEIANVNETELSELLDIEGTGDARLMAEASRDIEMLLEGKMPPANLKANIAYKKKFVDYMESNSEYLDEEIFMQFVRYVKSVEEIIIQNTLRLANERRNALVMSGELPVQEAQAPEMSDAPLGGGATNPNTQI